MKPAIRSAIPEQDTIRMGSEYASARDYLAREPRVPTSTARKAKAEPQHGSNDSDFGFADQRAD